jgi:hypothetical protein
MITGLHSRRFRGARISAEWDADKREGIARHQTTRLDWLISLTTPSSDSDSRQYNALKTLLKIFASAQRADPRRHLPYIDMMLKSPSRGLVNASD